MRLGLNHLLHRNPQVSGQVGRNPIVISVGPGIGQLVRIPIRAWGLIAPLWTWSIEQVDITGDLSRPPQTLRNGPADRFMRIEEMAHPAVAIRRRGLGRRLEGIVGKHFDPDNAYTYIRVSEIFQNRRLYRPGTLGRSPGTHGRQDGEQTKIVRMGVEVFDQRIQ